MRANLKICHPLFFRADVYIFLNFNYSVTCFQKKRFVFLIIVSVISSRRAGSYNFFNYIFLCVISSASFALDKSSHFYQV